MFIPIPKNIIVNYKEEWRENSKSAFHGHGSSLVWGFTDRLSNFIAGLMLAFMFVLMICSVVGDSATMDEVAHLPAGYSYITRQDMRLNSEHPPLMKDLAGLGALLWSKLSGQKINFPAGIKSWQEDINGQWDFGFNFLYRSGNNADKMLFWGRLPLILLTILLGIYLFKWARQLFGNRTALLALALFVLSPTFIAHGRLITTDVVAVLAIFLGLYYFIRWLKEPSWKKLIIAGVIFGLAQLTKFSVFLLVPLAFFIVLLWIISQKIESKKEFILDKTKSWPRLCLKYLGGLLLIFIIAYVFIVGPVYQYHILNYPKEKQISDIRFILSSYGGGPDEHPLSSCVNFERIKRCPAEIVIWMAQKPILRPWAQYLFGLLMVIQRAAGGNTTFFMHEVSASGWWYYFPVIYVLKEPLAMHILTIMALLYVAYTLKEPVWKKTIKRFFSWAGQHLAEFAMLSFIILYWFTSIKSPLNIGVRHILPTFPFIYILVSNQIIKWLKIKFPQKVANFWQFAKQVSTVSAKTIVKYGLVFVLLAWQFITIVLIFPYYIAYFNEIAGGPKEGYRYAVDSNLDWGQDLKRLAKWVEKNNIDKIYVDYFGGGVAEYYLGDKFLSWQGTRPPQELTDSKYLAVSATFLQGGRGQPVPGFTQEHSHYLWLYRYEPITVIGHSIFVYQID